MPKKHKIVRYATGIDPERSTEEIKLLSFRSEKIPTQHFKIYYPAIEVLTILSKIERQVLDTILLLMDQQNYILNNKYFKRDYYSISNADPIQPQTINKCFITLKEKGVLISSKKWKRGKYRVNPYLFWKTNEAKRIKEIRKIRELPFVKENVLVRRNYKP